ncbi:MAG: tRNA lysidine(34) synthetase TilS [Bacteroidales bacterium]|nr:tRNA lysidine(34) synthetase TilS [Bacteroidales bacterium]
MQNLFLKYIEENGLIRESDRILAAVSGGIDSMVMADLLLKSGYLSGVAHCNFGLRGKESDGDEEMVRKYASKHSIPFFSIRFNTKEYARKKGISIEMAARELRYDWFDKIRTKYCYDRIAVAHNLNDNIETLLLNLIRGTGIAGLSGMKPSAGFIIRPLLFATRLSIHEYCIENEIIYREDSTNTDTRFTRNKIRHKVLPAMKEINPSIESTLNETAERLGGVNDIISVFIAEARGLLFRERDRNIIVNIRMLEPYRNNKAVMFELFRPFGMTGSLLKDFQKVISGRTGGQLFTGTHRLLKNRNEIVITQNPTEDDRTFTIASVAGLKRSPLIESLKAVSIKKEFKINPDPEMAYLDRQKIVFPVIIRKWRSGDFFYPFGMNQKKKLSDYFIDKKLSRLQKEEIYIMESDGKIVWIIGERIDNRFRITKTTKKILLIKAKRN